MSNVWGTGLDNLGNDAIRASRQWSNFRSNGDKIVLGSKGNSLVCLGADRAIPPVPSGLALRRPRFWLELPPTGATSKRRRDSVSEDSDTITDLLAPNRPATLESSSRDDILRRFRGSAVHADFPRNSSGDALKNLLRGYSGPIVLYGADTDPALLQDPVFSKRRDLGRNPDGTFLRGHNDPAFVALKAAGSARVPKETIYMRTRDDSRDVMDAVFPSADDKHHFHIFAIPERRAADGPTLQSWAFGILLGPKAVGTWGSRAEGAGFGASTGTSKSE